MPRCPKHGRFADGDPWCPWCPPPALPAEPREGDCFWCGEVIDDDDPRVVTDDDGDRYHADCWEELSS